LGALGLAMAGFVAGSLAVRGPDKAEKGPIQTAQGSDSSGRDGASDNGRKKGRKTNLIPQGEFDKDPFAYVDVEKCRALLFSVTGDLNCKALTIDEMQSRVAEAEVAEKRMIIKNFLEEYCIVNPEDERVLVRSVVDEGCVLVEKPFMDASGGWVVNSRKSVTESCNSIELKSPPQCSPSLSAEEVERQAKAKLDRLAKDRMAEMAKLDHGAELIRESGLEKLLAEAKATVENHPRAEDAVRLLEKARNVLSKPSSMEDRKRLACALVMGMVAADDRGDQPNGFKEAFPDSERLTKFALLAEAMAQGTGVEDAEDCLSVLAKESIGSGR
jgi:hypothetical protein